MIFYHGWVTKYNVNPRKGQTIAVFPGPAPVGNMAAPQENHERHLLFPGFADEPF
jgi:hypothetical protein